MWLGRCSIVEADDRHEDQLPQSAIVGAAGALLSISTGETGTLLERSSTASVDGWIAPDPGLCSLQECTLQRWNPHLALLLTAAGASPTKLRLDATHLDDLDTLPAALCTLHNLRRLTLYDLFAFDPSWRFTSLKVLTHLEWGCTTTNMIQDFRWLEGFPALQELIIWAFMALPRPWSLRCSRSAV